MSLWHDRLSQLQLAIVAFYIIPLVEEYLENFVVGRCLTYTYFKSDNDVRCWVLDML